MSLLKKSRQIRKMKCEQDDLVCTAELLKNFGSSILSPKTHKICSSGRENLENMAVIESAYLSGRTGFPEEPQKILQMVPLGVDDVSDER